MAIEVEKVIEVIVTVGSLPAAIQPDDDIYDAGFSSIRALQLLTELEDEFNVTLPDDKFSLARTPRALSALIEERAS
ncbi:phosphopantetheine-binding protein [Sorangium cellulosum]|uniref:Phosphopantetheine-binding protein n=1 Tax=Sorangium cellulosum TaxID=56 RepID=A0A150S0Q2_SORCE|nr:phosphopantetheine-binding protein [Sorangium cellulosum]KYF95475.1 phosphopantetheine-binding protein [Sorangium cellulosum]